MSLLYSVRVYFAAISVSSFSSVYMSALILIVLVDICNVVVYHTGVLLQPDENMENLYKEECFQFRIISSRF